MCSKLTRNHSLPWEGLVGLTRGRDAPLPNAAAARLTGTISACAAPFRAALILSPTLIPSILAIEYRCASDKSGLAIIG